MNAFLVAHKEICVQHVLGCKVKVLEPHTHVPIRRPDVFSAMRLFKFLTVFI